MSMYHNSNELVAKMKFYSVMFGNDWSGKKSLESLTKKMPNGEMTHAPSAAALEKSMMRIIPSVF